MSNAVDVHRYFAVSDRQHSIANSPEPERRRIQGLLQDAYGRVIRKQDAILFQGRARSGGYYTGNKELDYRLRLL
jgi:hypothetical protein